MALAREKVRRHAVVVGVVVLTVVVDLWTKHWAAHALATDRHLLPVPADAVAPGGSVGDAVRLRFPSLSDADLAGNVLGLERGVKLEPEDRVFALDGDKGIDPVAFMVFERGDLTRFARRIERTDQLAIERLLLRSEPDLGFQEARRLVSERLASVTLRDWLARKLPHLSAEDLDLTIRAGTFPVRKGVGAIAPTSPAKAGEVYLLAHREVVLIPEHLDLSYAENPFGAWGILSDVDQGVRRGVFLVLSVVAILAIAFLLLRPPTQALVPLVALGGVLGGAIGNLVERVSPGYVVDFIHMYWGGAHWPRYNVADIGITVGVVVLVLTTGFRKEGKAERPSGR